MLHRVAGVFLALCLVSRSASANLVQADAAIADASIVDDEDAHAHADGGTAEPMGDAGPSPGIGTEEPATTPVDASTSTTIKIPSATGEHYSAPNDSGDGGCNATSTSSGALPALGLLAVLGLVRTRRRR